MVQGLFRLFRFIQTGPDCRQTVEDEMRPDLRHQDTDLQFFIFRLLSVKPLCLIHQVICQHEKCSKSCTKYDNIDPIKQHLDQHGYHWKNKIYGKSDPQLYGDFLMISDKCHKIYQHKENRRYQEYRIPVTAVVNAI